MTEKAHRYSIIVPAYNAAPYIRETIESVLAQTETDWEMIVVDDGSTDATAAVVADFADDRITYTRQENRGVSAARNAGFSLSRGEYILFLDADDILFANALLRLGQGLESYPDMVLSYGDCASFDSRNPPRPEVCRRVWSALKPSGDAFAAVLSNILMLVGTVLVRRAAVENVGGFDPNLKMGEDWVLWCDLAALGPIRYIGGAPVLGYRRHRDSSSRELALNPDALQPAIERLLSRPAVKRRFSQGQVDRFRRRLESSALRLSAREMMKNREWRRSRAALWEALRKRPLRIRTWGLLAFALVERLPPSLQVGT